MIKSMTGYSGIEKRLQSAAVSVEVRAYNSRFLDIHLKIPHRFLPLEEKIKGFISERFARGRIDMSIQVREEAEDAHAFEINTARAKAYHDALLRLKALLAVPSEVSLDMMVRADNVIVPVEVQRDFDAFWPELRDCIAEVFDSLEAMRRREGEHLAQDFEGRIHFIEESLFRIEGEAGGLPVFYQERLQERIATLLQGAVEIDPARLAQEVALLADRSDISEEIVRARSHVHQFLQIMNDPEPAGRKLNFLLQEFLREFNTMASKAGKAGIAHIVVDVKSELEKLREQVQNIE